MEHRGGDLLGPGDPAERGLRAHGVPIGPSSTAAAMSVATKPGATAVTAIPAGAGDTVSDWASACTPAFAAPYAGTSGSPR